MKTRVIINPDGKTCTTVNPYGVPPSEIILYSQRLRQKATQWQKAEQERKTYEISGCNKSCVCLNNGSHVALCEQPGTEHEAEIIDGKAVIS